MAQSAALLKAAHLRGTSEQASPSGNKAEIGMQTLSRGDPAGSDSEASDTEAHSVSNSQHQQKVIHISLG